MREVLMSLHICEQCCDVIRSAPSELITQVNELPCGEGFSRTEPPRGELLYHVASNGTNTPDFVRLRVPTFPNVRIMLNLIRGSAIGDVPVIIGSVDPCFSCTDRVTTVNQNLCFWWQGIMTGIFWINPVIALCTGILLSFLLRKLNARIQSRRGPVIRVPPAWRDINRTKILQPLYDILKLFSKSTLYS